MLSARDIREFRGFLGQATDRQVQGIYDKEKSAGRDDYAELAIAEAERRGIILDAHATKKIVATGPTELSEDAQRLQEWMITADTDNVAEALALAKEVGVSLFTKWPRARLNKARAELKAIGARHHSTQKAPAQLDREIAQSLVDTIRPGCRVTIVNRFGQPSTGKAVMRGPYGWILNMGGRHGTPAIATDDNVVSVRC
jgi:hypothetical protein